jgi:hypothetical protein
MSKFELKMQASGDELKVAISGIIDEDVDFSAYKFADSKKVEIDFKGVKSINSCGIREWIKWLAPTKSAQLTFINCPKIIIDQINMVDGFLPSNGKVLSFFVPYYNDENGSEKNVLYKYGQEFSEGTVTPPAKVVDDSGAEMEMDVIESKYFKFIKK